MASFKFMVSMATILCTIHSSGQSLHASPFLFRYAGIGTYSTTFIDVFSFSCNQAALSQLKAPAAGIYAERRFMLKELTHYAVVAALPFSNGGIGVSARYTGYKEYSQSQLGLAYGRALGETVALGVQFNYHLIRITGYGNAATINVEIGSIIRLTDKLFAGFHVYNPQGNHWARDPHNKEAARYTMGVGYTLSEIFYTSAEVCKEESQPVNVSISMHYRLSNAIFLRGGITTGNNNSFAGVGMIWKKIRIDVAGTYHPQLGITPSLMLVFPLKQKQE